jgi:hypothetical protein
VTAAPRDREAHAIAVLAALHGPDGPEEWQPADFDTAEAAARVVAEWVRRDGRADTSRSPETVQASPRKSRQVKRKPSELIAAEKVVRERSGGDCEARTPWCEGRATQVHHRAGRSDHTPEMLLDVCGSGNVTGCHGFIHQHPENAYAEGWLVKRNGQVKP